MRTSVLGNFILLLAGVPVLVSAQQGRDAVGGRRPFIEPFAGVFRDASDVGADGSTLGSITGARIGFTAWKQFRVLGVAGFAHTRDVGAHLTPGYYELNNDWLLLSAGIERDLIAGPASVSAGIELGAAWRRISESGQVGQPIDGIWGSEQWSIRPTAIPSVSVRRQVGRRIALNVGARGYYVPSPLDSHSLTLGVVFR